MSKSIRVLFALSMVAFIAACAPKKDEVVFVDEPVSTEPVFTGKFN